MFKSLQAAIRFHEGLPPLSVYIHVPWCVRKCPYCDFNSHALQGGVPENAFLDALEQDLIVVLPQVWGRPIYSVFIGGGTPSLLSVQAMDRIMMMLRNLLHIAPDIEITLEANPGTVEAQRFLDYASLGINRLSLGVQSFHDDALQRLGRIHNSSQAKQAIEIAQRAVKRVNIDLMYALPGQTVVDSERDIRTALGFGTEHLSLYNLTLEPNTVFAKYPPNGLPDEDSTAMMQDRLIELAAAHGLEQYEVSAYARAGARTKHNLNYWEFGDYIGIGPGAHGKISSHDHIVRTARVRSPESWMQKLALGQGEHIAETRLLSPNDLPFEFMLNALRLKEGVPTHYYTERTGTDLSLLSKPITKAVTKGLLDEDPRRLKASQLGWRYLNDLQEIFLT